MNKKVLFFLIFIFYESKCCDLTILGLAKFNDGLGRISITLMQMLKDELKINFLKTREAFPYDKEINQEIIKIINNSNVKNKSKVVILADSLNHVVKFKSLLSKNNIIKIAYSMFETTKIPLAWVKDLNYYFDAVIVPDEFFVDVYKNSGVKIPIFVLPIALFLDDFLAKKTKDNTNEPFVFGCLSSFDRRKNLEILIKSFYQEFGNNEKVILKINGRAYFNNNLKRLIKKLNAKNIQLTHKELSWPNYISFMSNFDCYVAIAKGEGFSIPPREALALGIPCILTNNTAQKTLCGTGFVRQIPSTTLEIPFEYQKIFGSKDLGYFFGCNKKDVRDALRDVYNNFSIYLEKAHAGKIWIQQYRWQNLKLKYLNLIKPKKVILGKKNIINDDFIMTNSIKLYNKYVRTYG